MEDKKQFLELIQSNIDRYGYHITLVNGSSIPRYAYTIGLHSSFGIELIFAGGIYFMQEDLHNVLDLFVREVQLKKGIKDLSLKTDTLGAFFGSKVHESWSKLTMLGVYDFFKLNTVEALQIKPDSEHFTLDIPDMSKEWNMSLEPSWKWLNKPWNYPVPERSNVVTNLKALQGSLITEVMRWENDEWEMFSGPGPDVEKEEIRVVPLGVLLGIDETLQRSLELEVGKGIWRETKEDKWNLWG